MIRDLFLLVIFLSLCQNLAIAQYKDEKINVQNFTPSVLLNTAQWEFKHFNNLYTQTMGFGNAGEKINYSQRSSYLTSINQFLYGLSDNLNIGFDAWVRSVKLDGIDSTPLELFAFENSPSSRTALAFIGPKIKFLPFKGVNRLSLQSTFLLPVAVDLESVKKNNPFLSDDEYRWINQLFYDRNINQNLQVFLELATWWGINRNGASDYNSLDVPLKAFISYFPDDRFTVYGNGEIWPSFGSDFIDSYFVQAGAGLKYQVIPGFLEGELSFGKFLAGQNQGAGTTYNLGIRIIQ